MYEYFTFILISGIIIVTLLSRFYAIAIVNGESMLPSFKHLDLLLVRRKYILEVGKVYLIKVENEVMLKRLAKMEANSKHGQVYLYFLGDNVENSFDSRNFGWCEMSVVIGEATKIF